MPRAEAGPRLKTKLVRQRAACEALCISRRTFWRHWHRVFTEMRSVADQHNGVERKVYEDELATAVDAGGHPSGRVAVLNFRGLMGRK